LPARSGLIDADEPEVLQHRPNPLIPVPIAERTGITRFDDSVRLLGSTFLEIMLEPVEHGIEKRWKVVGSRNISRNIFS
jgi:hypothetical protein